MVVKTRTVVHPQLAFDISKYESINPTHICSQKYYWWLCNHDKFILSDYDHDIIVDDIIRRDIIEYNKQISEYSQQYSAN